MDIYIPTTRSRRWTCPEILKQPQEIPIRIGCDELPVADLMVVPTIPFLLKRQVQRHACSSEAIEYDRDISDADLQIEPTPERSFQGSALNFEGPPDPDLVDHQLRVAEGQKTEAFLGPLIRNLESEKLTIECAARPPVADREFGDERVLAQALVPPTVIWSIRRCGWPTPTGTH